MPSNITATVFTNVQIHLAYIKDNCHLDMIAITKVQSLHKVRNVYFTCETIAKHQSSHLDLSNRSLLYHTIYNFE